MKILFYNDQFSKGVSTDLAVELIFIKPFFTDFFADKSYGKKVKKISFFIYAVDTEIYDFMVDSCDYNANSKTINCSVELDFKTVLKIFNFREFMGYVKARFINKAIDYEELNIDDFDLERYIEDLSLFFDNYVLKVPIDKVIEKRED